MVDKKIIPQHTWNYIIQPLPLTFGVSWLEKEQRLSEAHVASCGLNTFLT